MPETNRAAPSVAEEYATEVREPGGYRRSDADIAREIYECLADDVGLDASGIKVEVKQGEVTLLGAVRHCADMQRAEAHACAIGGVSCVRNELQPGDKKAGGDTASPVGAAPKMGKPTYDR